MILDKSMETRTFKKRQQLLAYDWNFPRISPSRKRKYSCNKSNYAWWEHWRALWSTNRIKNNDNL